MAEGLPPVIVEIIAKYEKLKSGMEGAAAEVKKFESKSAGALAGVQKVGKLALGGLAVAAVGVGYESIKMAGEFQKSTNLLVTAAGETPGALGKVRKGIEDIAVATGTSLPQLTEGMYQVEKAGFRGAGGLQILKAAAQGAAEEGANLGTVTNAMTSIMASFHLKASDSVGVMNALKTAAGGSKATMEEFAGSLSTVLPIASAAGLSFADVGGAIAALTRHGTSAAEATQELAGTIRNLQAPNGQAIKMMNQFGLSSVDLSQHLGSRGLGATIEMITNAIGKHLGPNGLVMIDTFKKSQSAANDLKAMMSGMPPALAKVSDEFLSGKIKVGQYRKEIKALPVDQYAMGQQFARLTLTSRGFSDELRKGNPQATTLNAALKTMMGGAQGLNTALMLTGENTGYLNEMTKKTAASMHDGAKNVEGWKSTSQLFDVQMARLKQTLDVLMVTIGSDLIPVVEKIGSLFAQHTGTLKVLALVIGGAVVASITAYVGGLVWAAGATVVNFVKMIVIGNEFAATQEAGFAKALAGIVRFAVFGAASMLRWAATMVVAGAEAMLPFLPIILAVAAVGVAAYELYKHWDQVWGFIKDVTKAAWGFIVGVFQTTVGFVKKHMAAIVGAIFLIFPPLGLAIAAVHEVYKHWSQIWGAIKSVTSTVVHAIVGFFRDVVHLGLEYIRINVEILRAVWDAVWGVIKSTTSAVWGFLKPIFSAIVTTGFDVIKTSLSALGSAWSSIWDTVKSVVASVWSYIGPILHTMADTIGTVAGALGKVSGLAGGLGKAGGGVLSGVGHMLGFSEGGVVPGPKGAPLVVLAHGGEQIISNEMQDRKVPTASLFGTGAGRSSGSGETSRVGGGGDITLTIPIHLDGKKIGVATARYARDELLRMGRGTVNLGLG